MNAWFGRHLDAPPGHRPVGVLDQIDLVKDGGKRCLDRVAGEVDERWLGGGHASTCGAPRGSKEEPGTVGQGGGVVTQPEGHGRVSHDRRTGRYRHPVHLGCSVSPFARAGAPLTLPRRVR